MGWGDNDEATRLTNNVVVAGRTNRIIIKGDTQTRKRIRQTEKRTERNRARRSRVRTFLRKVEREAKARGIPDGELLQARNLRLAVSELLL